MSNLLAGRFEYDNTSSDMLEQFNNVENIGIRWNVESGGVQRIEVTIKAKSRLDAYQRRSTHQGQRLAVYSSWCYRPISGYISEIREEGGNRVTYIAKGPSWRLEHELDTTVYASATTVSGAIQTILTDHAPHVSTNYDDIAVNSTTLSGWQPKTPEGTNALKAIQELIALSDSNNGVYKFWLVDEPFSGTGLGQYVAHYELLSDTADIDWQVNRRDLGLLNPSTTINNRVTDATVYYGMATFTANGGSNTTATRASGSFITDGWKPGDRFTNVTDESTANVVTVAATTLTLDGLSGGTADTVANGDFCSGQLASPKASTSSSVTPDTLWDVYTAVNERSMDATQAAQYAPLLVDDEAETDRPLSVGSRWIRDDSGARWPLWEVIAQGGGYLRVNDLYPAAALLASSIDKLSVFRIIALDYDHKSRRLTRVQVSKPDTRLDVALRKAKILSGEMIARSPRYAEKY